MSTSKDGLQKCLNNLETYCDKWKLDINTKKTKIVLFNRQGHLIKKHKFYYKLYNIEVAKEYKYLGFLFSCSYSATIGVHHLINQAKKAWFSIKYYLFSSKNKNIDTYLKLFDTQIKPILLYASDSWADSQKLNPHVEILLVKNKIEKFQISIFKQLLGVSRKTTNLAVLLELGRYPITLNMQYQAIKYFLRLSNLNNDRLIYELFQTQIQIFSDEDCFLSYVVNLLNNLGMSNIWRIHTLNNNKTPLKNNNVTNKAILTRITDIFSQEVLGHIQNKYNGKLTFLSSIKNVYQIEKYLKINNFKNRQAITKLRTSNHMLAIETGRWTKTERKDRFCVHCDKNKIEDEMHFLFECPKYMVARQETFQLIKSKTNIDLFYESERQNNLKLLFLSDDISALNSLGKFIKISFEKRSHVNM